MERAPTLLRALLLTTLLTGTTAGQEARPTPDHFGDGSDGDLVVSTTVDVNADRYVLTPAFGPGPVTITLSSPGFGVGDEVLVHQSQCSDAMRAGSWEFARVKAVAGSTVTLSSLRGSYTSGANEALAPGADVAQLVRVPQFRNVHVLPSGTIYAGTWAGEEGGIVVLRARGLLRIEGTIDVARLGFDGGAGDNAGTDGNARQGESFRGLGGESPLPNDSGGGGGETPVGNDGAGGGGAGQDLPGLDGFAHNMGPTGGTGGLPLAPNNRPPSKLLFGAGGGGGSIDLETDGDNGPGHSGSGGRGGGIVLLVAPSWTSAD